MFLEQQNSEDFPPSQFVRMKISNLLLNESGEWSGGGRKKNEERGGEEMSGEITSQEFMHYFLGKCFPSLGVEFLRGRDKNNT